MPEPFLSLPSAARKEALAVAEDRSGRPAHLLEKDVWVVWALQTLFGIATGIATSIATHGILPEEG